MSKLNFSKLHSELDNFIGNLVSKEFIEIAHKWACYDGEKINLFGVSIENKGIFERKYLTEKIEITWNDDNSIKDINVSDEKTEKISDIYDVSILRHSSRCTDYDAMLLVSERNPYDNEKYIIKIFLINGDDNDNGKFPKFNDIKTKIENNQYCGESLVREFCGTYQLISPNNYDRILCYTAIYCDLDELERYEENGNKEE